MGRGALVFEEFEGILFVDLDGRNIGSIFDRDDGYCEAEMGEHRFAFVNREEAINFFKRFASNPSQNPYNVL